MVGEPARREDEHFHLPRGEPPGRALLEPLEHAPWYGDHGVLAGRSAAEGVHGSEELLGRGTLVQVGVYLQLREGPSGGCRAW